MIIASSPTGGNGVFVIDHTIAAIGTSVYLSGSQIVKNVLVQTNPGYSNNMGNAGHVGTGTVISVVCG